MTLNEAIKHAEETADSLEREAECIRSWGQENDTKQGAINCEKCEEEHRQLAEWLKDYKRLKEQCSYDDCISRSSIKEKLQEHHDFFVDAYGGFSNLPQNDKSRVDEITNCIAMVVNEPSVTPQPKMGRWIPGRYKDTCSQCRCTYPKDIGFKNYCPNCGAKMTESR